MQDNLYEVPVVLLVVEDSQTNTHLYQNKLDLNNSQTFGGNIHPARTPNSSFQT